MGHVLARIKQFPGVLTHSIRKPSRRLSRPDQFFGDLVPAVRLDRLDALNLSAVTQPIAGAKLGNAFGAIDGAGCHWRGLWPASVFGPMRPLHQKSPPAIRCRVPKPKSTGGRELPARGTQFSAPEADGRNQKGRKVARLFLKTVNVSRDVRTTARPSAIQPNRMRQKRRPSFAPLALVGSFRPVAFGPVGA